MTLGETPEANAVAKIIADRCQGNRKPGQAPTRYATIYQAARLGAIEASAQQRAKIERYEAALQWVRNNASDPDMIRIVDEALK